MDVIPIPNREHFWRGLSCRLFLGHWWATDAIEFCRFCARCGRYEVQLSRGWTRYETWKRKGFPL